MYIAVILVVSTTESEDGAHEFTPAGGRLREVLLYVVYVTKARVMRLLTI